VDLYIHCPIRLHGVVEDRDICNKSSSCFCFTINSQFHTHKGLPSESGAAAGAMYNFVGYLTTLNSLCGLVVRVPTHSPTYRPTYLPTHLHTTDRPNYLPTYPPTYLPTGLPNYLPTHLHTGLPNYLPTHLHTYRPA
jgi:hypothetical protein